MGVRAFTWDRAKADANERKHGIVFEFGVRVFDDPGHVVTDVTRAVDMERREKAIGKVADNLYAVVFTERGSHTRLISARRANTQEERLYADRSL